MNLFVSSSWYLHVFEKRAQSQRANNAQIYFFFFRETNAERNFSKENMIFYRRVTDRVLITN